MRFYRGEILLWWKFIDYSINFHHNNISDIHEELTLFTELVKQKKNAKNYIYSEKNKIIKFVRCGDLYAKLVNIFKKSDFVKKDFDYTSNSGDYLSIDIKEANWSVLSDFGNLHITWEEFLKGMDTHKFLNQSKKFRQIIFGELNPKRIINLQKTQIWAIHEILKNNFNIVGVFEDEILIKVDGSKKVVDEVKVKLKNIHIPLKYKLFSLSQNICRYTNKKYVIMDEILLNSYKKPKLWSVPKRLFFIHMKDAMNIPLTKEDIIFSEDDVDYSVIVKTNKWNKLGLYI